MGTQFDFPGGIHPPDNKQQSLQEPIRQAPLPEQLIVPLRQHRGDPGRVLVRVGEQVLTGQPLSECEPGLSAPVHAPTSGTITAIEPHTVPHPSGLEELCIQIAADGRDQWCELSPCQSDAGILGRYDHLHRTGVVGLGGAGFPTRDKLQRAETAPQVLILNGAECEPYITADQALMRERPESVIAGARALWELVGAEQCLIGIEDNKQDAIEALKQAAQGTGIEIRVVPARYPSGGERQLIQLLTGREVPSGDLPADMGVLCQNVATAVAVERSLRLGEPVIQRITTLTGNALARPGNIEARIGTPLDHVLFAAGLDPEHLHRLIMGGPLMGFDLITTGLPLIKTANCLIAGTAKEFPDPPIPQPCIRCGLCEQACPVDLLPQQLYWFASAGEHQKAEHFDLFDCIECGACDWVCPSHLPLTDYFRHSKGVLRQEKKEQAEADHARKRFEERQARMEREQAEREERRRARQQAREQRQTEVADEAASEPHPAPAATGPDRETLIQRRDQARQKVEEAEARVTEAREQTPEAVPKLERALNKHRKRLEAAEQALGSADGEA
ncbi:electron transport complex subunit RsxC [Salicola sp. Rm-C-2C1-2]|uniref:electron transport complex subunit RsxC n=1 Tax=Salicola sp. Rm-C-2C1-2 TaxID=3141321 RepID=UPI0032E443B2